MSNIIPMNPPEKKDQKCSFCGTPQSKAKSMVSNPNQTRHICGKCVEQATQRLTEAA